MIRPACLAAVAMALAACSYPSHSDPANGRPTIVSLNPCADAILAEVAAPGQLLAISHYSHDPRASSMEPRLAARFRTTGGTVEEILALDPDVVVASTFMAPATRVALKDLGMRVELVGTVSTLAEVRSQVEELAVLAGDAVAGRRLADRIDAASAQRRGEPVPAILWQPGGIVPGRGALVTETMARAGFASLSAARGMAQADYLPLERILADPPRVLFVAGSEQGQRHPVLTELRGTETVTMPANLLYCGGPTIIRAMEFLDDVRERLS